LRSIFFFLLIIVLSLLIFPKVKVFIIPFSHLDIGFTATQREVSQKYTKMFSELINILERVEDFSFTVESYWQFQQWIDSEPSELEIERFHQYVSQGRIEFAAAFANMHTGFLNSLTLREMVEFPMRKIRELGFEVTVCMQNDVPGYSAHLPDVLYDLGIKYLMIGVNDGYASVLKLPSLASVFWWEGPRGGKVLTYVTKNSYAEGILIKSASGLEKFVENVRQSGYPYDVLPVLVAFDNAGYEPGIMALLRFGRFEYDDMDVVVSTPSKFFKDLEERYSDFPTYRGDWSGWWEIVKTGGPYSSSAARWTQDTLRDLLEIGAISEDDGTYNDVVERLLLYGEHSSACGAGWPGLLTLEQINESNETVVRYAIEAYEKLWSFIEKKFVSHDVSGFAVLNRSKEGGVLSLKIPYESAEENDIALVEINGEDYLAWYFSEPATNAYEPYSKGFKVFAALKPGENELSVKQIRSTYYPKHEASRIENDFYEISLNEDGTFDIFDKQLERTVMERAGIVKSNFTTNQDVVEVLSLRVTSAVLTEYPQEKTFYVVLGPECPLQSFRITLPNGRKAIIVEYFLSRDRLPYVPYERHSINYYVAFPLIRNCKMLHADINDKTMELDQFPAARPAEFCLNGYLVVDTGLFKYAFASREAFMIGITSKENAIKFHLVRHYSETATRNKGIVRLLKTEPNTPDLIRFSFLISTSDTVDSKTLRDFLHPTIVFENSEVIH